MTEHIEDLAQAKLFSGIAAKDIPGLLDSVQAHCVTYAGGNMIIEEGSKVTEFGIILSGHGRSIKWDASDKLIIITLLEKGSEIGVLLAARPEQNSPVSVQALDDVTVLQIPYRFMVSQSKSTCPGHEQLLRNYIAIVAEKGLVLHERINCLLKPTVRDKILTYLTRLSREQKSRAITVPMNRNAMAEYLNVERSALSRELSYMKRDGLIDYQRNDITLI